MGAYLFAMAKGVFLKTNDAFYDFKIFYHPMGAKSHNDKTMMYNYYTYKRRKGVYYETRKQKMLELRLF